MESEEPKIVKRLKKTHDKEGAQPAMFRNEPQTIGVEEEKAQTVIIQFRDADLNDVGFEISVDAGATSKADLNKLLRGVREPSQEDPEHQIF